MFRPTFVCLLATIFITVDSIPVDAQRRGGRGGGRSGASRSVSRPSSSRSVSRPPQFRGQPSSSRSNINRGSLPSNNNRSSINRSSINRGSTSGNLNRNSGNLNRNNLNRGGSSTKPSRSQLDSFLGSSNRSRSSSSGKPSTLPAPSGGWNSKTFETARGGSITVGKGAGSKTGSGGGQVGGAGRGIKIETAGGKTVSKGSLAAGGRGPGGNSAVGGVTGGKATDGRGNAVGGVRGGAVDSRGNYRGGSATGRKNNWGYAQVNTRGVQGNLRSGNSTRVSRSAVRGPYGNVVTTGRGARFVNGQFVGGRTWTTVNGRYTRWGYFGGTYWRRYPGAWWPGKWAVGTAWWIATWRVAAPYCGFTGPGIYYDYGNNVVYQDNSVTYEGETIATADEYYDQASDIAAAGNNTKDEEWMPLGVFALVKDPEQTETEKVLQLALNRDGAIRGNLHDLLTEDVKPVIGSVQKDTQRVSLKLEGNDNVVVDCGLYNLTNDEVPILIHFSKDKRQDAMLIRLKNPEEEQPEE